MTAVSAVSVVAAADCRRRRSGRSGVCLFGLHSNGDDMKALGPPEEITKKAPFSLGRTNSVVVAATWLGEGVVRGLHRSSARPV